MYTTQVTILHASFQMCEREWGVTRSESIVSWNLTVAPSDIRVPCEVMSPAPRSMSKLHIWEDLADSEWELPTDQMGVWGTINLVSEEISQHALS